MSATIEAAVANSTDQGIFEMPSADAPLKDWALYWAGARGIPVFPCGDRRKPGTLPKHWNTDPSKTPRGGCTACKAAKDRKDNPVRGKFCYAQCGHRLCHGVLGATTDLEIIAKWWDQFPNANIGGVMGPDAGVLAIEADVAHKVKDKDGTVLRVVDGREMLAAEIEANAGEWPETWTNLSGSGGPHYLFQYPARPRSDGKAWGNGVGGENENKVAEGVDVRGDGGYIVLPPSSSNKGVYRIDQTVPLAPAPEWALARIDKAPAPRRQATRSTGTTRPFASTGNRVQDASRAMFNAAIDNLRNTGSYRNHALNQAAYAVAGLVFHQDSGITEQEARAALWDAAVANGYVAKDGEGAAKATLESGWDNGMASPANPWPPEDRPFTPTKGYVKPDLTERIHELVFVEHWDRDDVAVMLNDEQIRYIGLDAMYAKRDGAPTPQALAPARRPVVVPAPRNEAPAPTEGDEAPATTPEDEDGGDEQQEPTRPKVYAPTNGRDLAELSEDTLSTWRIVQAQKATTFTHGTDVVVHSGPELVKLGGNSLSIRLAQDIEFYTFSTESKNERKKAERANAKAEAEGKSLTEVPELEEVPADPPKVVVASILEAPALANLAEVDRVSRTPYFDEHGELITTPGYNRRTRMIYEPVKGVDIPTISRTPSKEDVTSALALINTMIQGFKFETPADRAHFFALPITCFARKMIDGPSPIFGFDSATNREGKGLLASCGLRPVFGEKFKLGSAPTAADEWEKKIVSGLRPGPQVLIFDNVNIKLDSGAFASAATSWPLYQGRILGQSDDVELPAPAAWVITGRNLTGSTEITERMLRIRINSGVEHPGRRTDFAIPNLPKWIGEHQGELVWAWCTLVADWVAAGQPKAKVPAFGGYEQWVDIVGSILEHHDITELLANRDELSQTADEEGQGMKNFVFGWAEHDKARGDTTRNMAELLDLITGQSAAAAALKAKQRDADEEGGHILYTAPTPEEARHFAVCDAPFDLGGGNQLAMQKKLGAGLTQYVGHRFGDYVLRKKAPKNRVHYYLEFVG